MFDPGHKQPEKLVYTNRTDFDHAWSTSASLGMSNLFSVDLAQHGHGAITAHSNGGPTIVGTGDRTCTLSNQETSKGVVAEYCAAYSAPGMTDRNVTVSLIDLEKGPIGYEGLIINDLSKTDPTKLSSDIDGDGHPDSFVGLIMDETKPGKAKYLIMVESE